MSWKRWVKNLLGGAKQARVTDFSGPLTSEPGTPGRSYICANCGMLITSGHRHTREECKTHDNDPTKPDGSLRRIMKERPAINDPKISLPHYHTSRRTAKNES